MKLLNRLKNAVTAERSSITAVLRLLIEADDSKLYAEMAYSSLIDFCIKELGYSEGAAWRRVRAAQLLRNNPEVAEKIEEGSLSLMNAAQVQNAIHQAKREKVDLPAEELIQEVSHTTTREAEKKIAKTARSHGIDSPEEDPIEEKFRRLRAHFSHKNPNPTHKELLHLMADEILGRKGDIKKEVKNPENPQPPKKLAQAIFHRDGHQCTFVAGGRRCEGTHFLQCDHIIPVAHGGLTIAENLRTLCQTHNLLEAERRGLRRPDKRNAQPAPVDSPIGKPKPNPS